jgi:hypothetical protein
LSRLSVVCVTLAGDDLAELSLRKPTLSENTATATTSTTRALSTIRQDVVRDGTAIDAVAM